MHSLLSQRFRQSRKGISLRANRCDSCTRQLRSGPKATITAFQCRHAFHTSCIPEEIDFCIVCKPTPVIAKSEADDQTNLNQVLLFFNRNIFLRAYFSFV